ncbi:unnamed protein product [Enterobius vermicularis]|uniref:Uncharacterized protein n=1 Tax=Enterobius vermicularis TaxID=51028 RepID=A0A0N4UVH0_ENTVE|nr:unnamed protein product [Enterobius vermicularis]
MVNEESMNVLQLLRVLIQFNKTTTSTLLESLQLILQKMSRRVLVNPGN